LVLLYVQDYVTVVPHLTEVRFGYGWKVTAYSKAGQRLRFIIFWIVNYQIGEGLAYQFIICSIVIKIPTT
jgi:hypothetical protein